MIAHVSRGLKNVAFVIATGVALLSSKAMAAPPNSAPSRPAAAVPEAPAEVEGPMTREKASGECWMKYDKEARSLSLDQKIPLVEKCTANKLKASGT